jgi:hypothetical protein
MPSTPPSSRSNIAQAIDGMASPAGSPVWQDALQKGSALLRIYTGLSALAGLRFSLEEAEACVRLIGATQSPRVLRLGLALLFGAHGLLKLVGKVDVLYHVPNV